MFYFDLALSHYETDLCTARTYLAAFVSLYHLRHMAVELWASCWLLFRTTSPVAFLLHFPLHSLLSLLHNIVMHFRIHDKNLHKHFFTSEHLPVCMWPSMQGHTHNGGWYQYCSHILCIGTVYKLFYKLCCTFYTSINCVALTLSHSLTLALLGKKEQLMRQEMRLAREWYGEHSISEGISAP